MAEQIDYVGYGIDSGPLPPMYYTRKELIAQPDRITVKRWTGMEAPFEESFPLTANQFQQIVDALTHYGIRSRQLEIPEGEPPPSGGGSEWVVVKAQDMLLMKGGVEVEGDVKQLVQLLESFVPEEGRPRSPLME